jgi:Tfp pilus assembly PilM family ATPase
MKNFDVNFGEAEQIKRTQGLTAKDLKKAGTAAPGGGLTLTDRAPLEKLADEINRSLRYYVKETGQSAFMKFVLFGGLAESRELCDFLSTKFSIPADAYDPFAHMDGAGDVRGRAQFAAAVGLAARAQAIY